MLRFHERVLLCAQSPAVPIMERFRFLCILADNLDEFFELRMSALQQWARQVHRATDTSPYPDQYSPQRLLPILSEMAHQLIQAQYATFADLQSTLASQHHIGLRQPADWTADQRAAVHTYFAREVLPVLTPIALDLTHPFPKLANKSLNFIVELTGQDAFGRHSGLAVIHMPSSIEWVMPLPPDPEQPYTQLFAWVPDVMASQAASLFPGMQIAGCYPFRLTRNSDLMIDALNSEDLAQVIKLELRSRRYGDTVRLEACAQTPPGIVDFLLKKFQLTRADHYAITGPLPFTRLQALCDAIPNPALYAPPVIPRCPLQLESQEASIWDMLQKQDILLHHPYESFEPVIRFIQEAARDPHVVAIRQTVYRIDAQSPVIDALLSAAHVGKEVTVIIELMARFDEADNVALAARLQEAGAIVVYGVVGHKTHAKMTSICRREGLEIRHYTHLGTGNYHAIKARYYTDFSFLTADRAIGSDIHRIFQHLTGMGQAERLTHVIQAPFYLKNQLQTWIQTEIQNAQAGYPARIMAKLNGLTDPDMIHALYQASQAGVQVDLLIRGMCSLVPGVPGLSERITVKTVVGRFLEHARIYYFENHPHAPHIYLSSADWMERNLSQRLEIAFPIRDEALRARIIEEGITIHLGSEGAFTLQSDGTYAPPQGPVWGPSQLALLQAGSPASPAWTP